MALDTEFKTHLHSLMVEMYDKTIDEIQQYKRQRLSEARQTHNSAAMPIAYKDAALKATEIRVGKTIEKYIEAVKIWGFEVTPAFERDMITEIQMLTAGPKQLQFPPGVRQSNHTQAVQGSYARERAQLTNRLVREGTNRLRELKAKVKRERGALTHTTINNFNAPIGKLYNNSIDQSVNNFTISISELQQIDSLSEGHAELQALAQDIRNPPPGSSMLEKVQRWATLVNSLAGISEKIHQHYPQIEALISSVKHLA